MSRPQRIDIDLIEVNPILDASVVKTGEKVEIVDDIVWTLSPAHFTLGRVPPDLVPSTAPSQHYCGHVRTIKRNPDDPNSIIGISIRLVKEDDASNRLIKPTVNLPPEGPSHAEDDESQLRRLSRQQLEHLANDDRIRNYLRDERLQAIVRDIDGAENREVALQSMMNAPNFKEFADEILGIVAPEPSPVVEG